MLTFFALLAATGLVLLVMLPLPKDRTKRLLSQAGCTSLFALGLCGSMLQIMSG
jgi:hypothetical protein